MRCECTTPDEVIHGLRIQVMGIDKIFCNLRMAALSSSVIEESKRRFMGRQSEQISCIITTKMTDSQSEDGTFYEQTRSTKKCHGTPFGEKRRICNNSTG